MMIFWIYYLDIYYLLVADLLFSWLLSDCLP